MIEYQDSGVEWIGQIPSHWEVKRLKDITKLNPPCTELNIDAEVSFVPMENLRCAQISCQEIPFIEARGKYTYFEDEDLLIAKVTPCFENNNIAIAKELKNGIGFGSSEIFVLRCSDILNSFLFYYVLSSQFKEKACSTMCGVGGLKRISPLFMTTYKLAIPPLSEQQAIADYLDEKTAEIETQVSLIKEKVATLQKLKQSLINKVVTKGLNPDAELKGCGEDWLGQIPAHWEVKRLKSFARTIKGKAANYQDSPSNGAYKVLSVECLRQENANFYDYAFTDDAEQICTSEDFVVIWDGAGVGEFLKAKDGVLSSTIAKFKFTSKDILPSYFWHWRYKIEMIIKSIPTGMGIPHLNPVLLNNLKFAIPPLSEQQAIADYLDAKTAEIDEQIGLLNQKAEAYNKLKQSLIDEVVTGKRRI